MLLKDLINNSTEEIIVSGSLDKDIKGISHDSRDVKEGFVFVCISGIKLDGHKYIDDAIKNGASAIIIENKQYLPSSPGEITYIYNNDSRTFLSLLSSNFYGNPSKKLKVIGITGTNGKTTCVYMVSSILKACGIKHSMISTVENIIVDEVVPPSNTTPESLITHSLLAKTLDKGGEYAVIECSSHGIEMKRTVHVYLDYAGFTNITYDHMDKHQTIEGYFATKRSLVNNVKTQGISAVAVNNDDKYLRTITKDVVTYGIENEADIMAENIKLEKFYSTFTLVTPKGSIDIKLNTPGRYNIYNALNSAAIAYMDGIDLEYIKRGLEIFKNVDGRMDFIENNLGINVFIDFAHNPDGLEQVFKTVKDLFGGDIVIVTGLGMYADPDKYSLVGAMLNKYCKMSVLTTEYAEFFDPVTLVEQIAAPMDKDKYVIEMDRYKAIALGFTYCKPGDVLFILGRGHMTHMKMHGQRLAFKDADAAREIIANLEKQREVATSLIDQDK